MPALSLCNPGRGREACHKAYRWRRYRDLACFRIRGRGREGWCSRLHPGCSRTSRRNGDRDRECRSRPNRSPCHRPSRGSGAAISDNDASPHPSPASAFDDWAHHPWSHGRGALGAFRTAPRLSSRRRGHSARVLRTACHAPRLQDRSSTPGWASAGHDRSPGRTDAHQCQYPQRRVAMISPAPAPARQGLPQSQVPPRRPQPHMQQNAASFDTWLPTLHTFASMGTDELYKRLRSRSDCTSNGASAWPGDEADDIRSRANFL
jgi:hypothetical protein